MGIIDHHADESHHLDARPRIINTKAGSCASLLALHFRESKVWTSEIANLLLAAMCVDTGGFRPGGKATEIDVKAARFLLGVLASSSSVFEEGERSLQEEKGEEGVWNIPLVQNLTTDLLTKKNDISQFSNRDLLRRDYKEYTYPHPNTPDIKIGLSTVPLNLKHWVQKDANSIAKWMTERSLTILGVLTTFHTSKKGKKGKEAKSMHKRQQLWVMHGTENVRLEMALRQGLETNSELALHPLKNWERKLGWTRRADGGEGDGVEGVRATAYKQGNANATRKVIAPLIKSIIEQFHSEIPNTQNIISASDSILTRTIHSEARINFSLIYRLQPSSSGIGACRNPSVERRAAHMSLYGEEIIGLDLFTESRFVNKRTNPFTPNRDNIQIPTYIPTPFPIPILNHLPKQVPCHNTHNIRPSFLELRNQNQNRQFRQRMKTSAPYKSPATYIPG